MKAVSETVVHAAIVGPVFLLAGMIEASARVCRTAAAFADVFAGEPRPPQSGFDELRMT